MRVTAILLCVAALHTSLKGISQKLTFSGDNVPPESVFTAIRQQTGYAVFYNHNMLKQAKPVTLHVKEAPIAEALEQCFKGQPFTCRIVDKTITVIEKGESAPQRAPLPPSAIEGRVTDEKGNPLQSASIIVKGTGKGATSNKQGEFSLQVSADTVTLVVSCLGYGAREITVTKGATVTIALKAIVETLRLIEVSTGIYTRPAESFTGAAVTFTSDQLKTVSNQNILQSLKVLDPSFVQIENNLLGSDPNTLPDIQIRGVTTLPDLKGDYNANPNLPLFILDGFETSLQKIYDLDMNRVATITLLKDAAAKAIYGSRAANGVVVVETKRPQAGKLRITYNADLNINLPDLTSYDLTNAAEKLQAELDAGRYTGAYEPQTQALMEQYNETYKNVVRGVNTYWLSKPVRTGIGQKHSAFLEGGDQYLRYGVDLAYNKISGVMKGSDRQTTSGTVTLSYRVSKLLFRNLLTATFNRADDSPYGAFSAYTQLNPYWAPYDSAGRLRKVLGQFQPSSGAAITYYNPMYNATLGTKNFSRYTEITNNFYAEWSLLPSLKLVGRFGFTQKQDTREDFYPANHTRYNDWAEEDYFKRGEYTITDGIAKSFKPDLTLNYNYQRGPHQLLFNAGWNMYQSTYSTHSMRAQGFLNDRVDYISFARQYAENGRPSGTETTSREIGLLSALNYSYDNRYLLDLTFRRNGSSVYGANNRWGNFWSAGLGWNLHREDFLAGSSTINLLKLRGSIGYTGNQNFNPYQAMATYDYFTDTYYDNVVGAKLLGLANNDLKWQQTQDINIGLDAQLFRNLNFRFDYYVSNSDNLLIDLTLAPSAGFSTWKQNLGSLRNTGFDATISCKVYSDPRRQAFLSLYASAAHNKNKIVRLNNALESYNNAQDKAASNKPLTRYKEGQSTTVIWAVPSLGIDPITGQEVYRAADGSTTYNWNAADQAVVGESRPALNGSFGFNGEYKGFGINCAFTYRFGAQYYNQTLVDRVENVDIQYNVDRRVFTQTWKNPGDVAFYKQIRATPSKTYPSSRFVEDLNEWQLTSLNAFYDFRNSAFIKRAGMQALRFTFYMVDVFRVSTVKAERGTDYPFARTLSCSLKATF